MLLTYLFTGPYTISDSYAHTSELTLCTFIIYTPHTLEIDIREIDTHTLEIDIV